MTEVPCSIIGCKLPGTRWFHEEVEVAKYAFPPGYKSMGLDIPRFVCDTHARELLARGHASVTPSLPA